MVATVIVVVSTHDLSNGVGVGVLLSALFFARKVGQVLHVGSAGSADGCSRAYSVTGQRFFASAERSEERRVGEECVRKGRYRWYRHHEKKKHSCYINIVHSATIDTDRDIIAVTFKRKT